MFSIVLAVAALSGVAVVLLSGRPGPAPAGHREGPSQRVRPWVRAHGVLTLAVLVLAVACFPLSAFPFGGWNAEGFTFWGNRLASVGMAGLVSVVYLVPLTIALHVLVRFVRSALGRRLVTGLAWALGLVVLWQPVSLLVSPGVA